MRCLSSPLTASAWSRMNSAARRNRGPRANQRFSGSDFVADDGVSGRELFKSDGTAGGTALVRNLYSSSALPSELTWRPENAAAARPAQPARGESSAAAPNNLSADALFAGRAYFDDDKSEETNAVDAAFELFE